MEFAAITAHLAGIVAAVREPRKSATAGPVAMQPAAITVPALHASDAAGVIVRYVAAEAAYGMPQVVAVGGAFSTFVVTREAAIEDAHQCTTCHEHRNIPLITWIESELFLRVPLTHPL